MLFALGLPALRLAFLVLALSYHVSALQDLADHPSPTAILSAGPTIEATRRDITALHNDAGFLLRSGPAFRWVPLFGPDLVYANELLNMAAEMSIAADETYRGLSPLMTAALGDSHRPAPEQVLDYLVAAEPNLRAAQRAAANASAARATIPQNQLSPVGQRLVNQTDRLLLLMRQAIAAINVAPALMGADGAKTYLMLIQNQDELRPTGGFISAAGLLTIERGDIKSMELQDSYAVGSFSIPDVPRPLAKYMDSTALPFRDANWSPDFPTTAALAIRLYQGDHPQAKIDGVIALDQAAIRALLEATGPISVVGLPEPISADNLVNYVRASWSAEPDQAVNYDWWLHRKDFIQNMAASLTQQLARASWTATGQAATLALRERHITVWLADKPAGQILAEQGWDGAIQPGTADYLMVVEANVGFNKVNALVQRQIDYVADLSNLQAPFASVTVTDFNPAAGPLPCLQDPSYGSGNYAELINRCYWNYLRIYTRADSTLLDAQLHDIPAEWNMTGRPILGTVDVEPGEHETQSVGTLVVVPFGAAETTSFKYGLAPQNVGPGEGGLRGYSLKVQKQPGTQGTLFTVTIRLPGTASVVAVPANGQLDGHQWSAKFLLDEDVQLAVKFRFQP